MACFGRWVAHPEEDLYELLDQAFLALEVLGLSLAAGSRPD